MEKVYCDYEKTIDTSEELVLYYYDMPADVNGGFFAYYGRLIMPGYGTGYAYCGPAAFTLFSQQLRANYPYPSGVWAVLGSPTIRMWIAVPASVTPPADWIWINENDLAETPLALNAGTTDAQKKCYQTDLIDLDPNPGDQSTAFMITMADSLGSLDPWNAAGYPLNDATFLSEMDILAKAFYGTDATIEVSGTDPEVRLKVTNTYVPMVTFTIGGTPNIVAPFTETPCI